MVQRPRRKHNSEDKSVAFSLMKLLLIKMISIVSSTASTSSSTIQNVSSSNDVESQSQSPASSSPTSQASSTIISGKAANDSTTTIPSPSQETAVLTQSRASNSSGSQLSSTVDLGNAAIRGITTTATLSTTKTITPITGTTTDASSALTSSNFLGLSTIVPGEAVINGTQTMTQFVFLSMTRNLQNGTRSVAAPTSLPTNVNAKHCSQKGGLICLWWWGSVGWGLCLSCTPNGIDPKIGGGTHITIDRPPKWPTISPPRCLWPFPCPNPPPGTEVQTVEGVENEPPGIQPTVDGDDADGDPEPSESANTYSQAATTASHTTTNSSSSTSSATTASHTTTNSNSSTSSATPALHTTTTSSSSTSSASSVATSFAIYPVSANYTATNNAFNTSLYQIADPATLYVSVEEDLGVLFWLADLNSEQVQNLSSYGVSVSNR